MSIAVAATSHDHMLPPLDRRTPRAHVFGPPEGQTLEAALTGMDELLRQHGHVVVVHPAALPTPHLHRLHAVRSVLESDRIALVPVPLPPLGTGVLLRQLRQLSLGDFGPGVLGAAARLLTHYVYAGAVLGSVAKLDHIPVTLTAHAKSWLPGVQFAVLAHPEPQLVRLRGRSGGSIRADGSGGTGEAGGAGGASGGQTLPGPRFPTELTLATGRLETDWITRHLAREWRTGTVHEARLPEDSPAWWGTARLTEFAAAIADTSVLHRLVASVRRDRCHWCGLELIGDRCVFCAAPVQPRHPAPPVAAAEPSAGAAPASPTAPAGPVDPRTAPAHSAPPPHRQPTLPGSAVTARPRGLRP